MGRSRDPNLRARRGQLFLSARGLNPASHSATRSEIFRRWSSVTVSGNKVFWVGEPTPDLGGRISRRAPAGVPDDLGDLDHLAEFVRARELAATH